MKLVFNEKLLPNKLIAFRAEQIPFENGAWPAFWLAPATGSWGETAGEIDIYETVNGENKGVATNKLDHLSRNYSDNFTFRC